MSRRDKTPRQRGKPKRVNSRRRGASANLVTLWWMLVIAAEPVAHVIDSIARIR